MSRSALIDAPTLAAALTAGPAPGAPVVLHATVELPAATVDGQSPAASGLQRFRRGHLPGARHADLLTDLADPGRGYRFAQPAAGRLAQRLAGLGVGAGTRVVTYDDDGSIWAARVFWALRAIGHDQVTVLDGGLAAWQAAGGALEAGDAAAAQPVTPIVPAPRPDAFVDQLRVLELLVTPTAGQLVCTLSPSSFNGTVPSRYARRGHIPGSVNVASRSLVDDAGRLLPAAQLRAQLAPLLRDERPITLYCGGGISASLAALALHRVGRDDVSIYDGSLEEWAADPNLPLETTA